jgi:hypothetical protein
LINFQDCKKKVNSIVADCRKQNKKFRDYNFDLDDKEFVLTDLLGEADEEYTPGGIGRITHVSSLLPSKFKQIK